MVRETIQIPDDVTAEVDHLDVTIDGPNGTVSRRLWYPDVNVRVEDDAVVVESDAEDAKTMSTVGTFRSHIENAIHGVQDGWTYDMEVFYSHFPMQVRVEGDEVVIENFLGERAPRRTTIHGDNTVVDIDDQEETVTVRGPDKESVGQTAADIEQLTRVTDKDVRVFQDGVYITSKPTGGAT